MLNGYTNVDMTGDVGFKESTFDYTMTRGEKCITLSSTKAKHIIVIEKICK